MSKIEWTQKTWNPVAGCTIVSAGCTHCYAMTMAYRLGKIQATQKKYGGLTRHTKAGKAVWNGQVRFDEKALLEPLKRKKPTMYFVNSMSDLMRRAIRFRTKRRNTKPMTTDMGIGNSDSLN